MSGTQRKLTTIFAADVEGYSRLMEADEEGTLATLKQYREAMARLIGSRGGRVVNTWGDGVLAEFPSVVEAVRAAVDVQNELADQNAGRSTKTRMQFRIGLNLGDVIVDGVDIYGDGVNIAARLQAQAPAGGIVISNTVYDQVRNKVPVGFEFLGNLSVKNIMEGVPSYAIRIGEQASGQAEPAPKPFLDAFKAATIPVGRNPAAAALQQPLARLEALQDASVPKSVAVFALIGAGLVAINMFTGGGYFWARWPLLVLATIAALTFVKNGRYGDRGVATLVIIGLFIVGINFASWSGEFWAKWPLLGLAIVGGIRWATRSRAKDDPAR